MAPPRARIKQPHAQINRRVPSEHSQVPTINRSASIGSRTKGCVYIHECVVYTATE